MPELASLIARHARYRPEAVAVVFGEERLTYRAFWARVARAGNLLRALGIGRGDKVATVASNSLALLETYWAVPTIGAVLVPLSPLLLRDGLASQLAACDARCVVTESSMLPILATMGEELRARVLVVDGAAEGGGDYRALCAGQPEDLEPEAVPDDALFNIMFTSGTTGMPKGIMHTHDIRSMYALLMGAAFRMTPESRVLHSGAIVFNGAFVTMMPVFHQGGAYVLMPRFDAEEMIAAIERERVTHVMLVPSQIVALLGERSFEAERLASLECIVSLGAPLLQETREQLAARLPGRLYELYGLTEGFVTILDRAEAAVRRNTVGVPPPFFQMRILREDGSEAGIGEAGEIVGRGPILMTGYYNRPDLTAQAVRDGWLHTGDVGYVDADGYLHLVDRLKDMIDSGGVKVYPRDIEEVAARHPAVREVAVFGVPDDKWGETPFAAVILHERASATADELREWINARVGARFQRVSCVAIMPDFPRNAAGKTLKGDLRAPHWAGRGRRI